MNGQWRRCSKSTHVASWEYVTLKPSNDIEEEEIDDPTYEGHHEALIDTLLIGDNFIIPAPHDNNDHVDFYVLKFIHEKVCLDSPLQDAWGNECLWIVYGQRGLVPAKG